MKQDITSKVLTELATSAGESLLASGHRLVTAESCTGGGIMQTMTGISGSSGWCEGGFITYSNRAKQIFLGVSADILASHGAVSAETVQAMACGALDRSDGTIAVAVSGVAGPDGGTEEKPVGTVWIAWAGPDDALYSKRFMFIGGRDSVRRQAIYQAISRLPELTDI